VQARLGLADVLRGRCEVHGQAARGEVQRQVEQLIQMALRGERDDGDGDRRLHGVVWLVSLPGQDVACRFKAAVPPQQPRDEIFMVGREDGFSTSLGR